MFIQEVEDVYHSVANVAHIMIFVNFVQNSSCNTYFTFKHLEHNYFLFLKKNICNIVLSPCNMILLFLSSKFRININGSPPLSFENTLITTH